MMRLSEVQWGWLALCLALALIGVLLAGGLPTVY
jgi:hypothetical protein